MLPPSQSTYYERHYCPRLHNRLAPTGGVADQEVSVIPEAGVGTAALL
jgi:hypothetical protein